MLDDVRIVLVRTFHPGNIGSAARCMKTMGLTQLYLVAPKQYPSAEAEKMAAGAADILESVTVVTDLYDAVADCNIVIATSARSRDYDTPVFSPEQAARFVGNHCGKNKTAILFGPERMGLHNEDLLLARYRIDIPGNPAYRSLNLAAAVQIVCYELFKAAQEQDCSEPARSLISSQPTINSPGNASSMPSTADFERFHAHLEAVLQRISFLRTHRGETLSRIRNLFDRAQLTSADLNIPRGILSAVEKKTADTQQEKPL